jgi:uncharacterized short protein YbdD (DUF466 family)
MLGRWSFLRSRVPSFLRRLAGMPDYAAHIEHLRHCHPETPIPSEREFYNDFVRARYGDGPTRCCWRRCCKLGLLDSVGTPP